MKRRLTWAGVAALLTLGGAISASIVAGGGGSGPGSSTTCATFFTTFGIPPTVSGFPCAANTGVPSGVALTAYTGPSTINTCNETSGGANGIVNGVIDRKMITGGLTITASRGTNMMGLTQAAQSDPARACVVITNSKIEQTSCANTTCTGVIAAIDTTFNQTGPTYIANTEIVQDANLDNNSFAAGSSNTYYWNDLIHGGRIVIRVSGGNNEIHNTYAYDVGGVPGSHGDMVLSNGNSFPNLIDHSTLSANQQPGSNPDSTDGDTDLFGDNSPGIVLFTVVNSLFLPTAGSYEAYTGADQVANGKPFPIGTHLIWRNNVFTRGSNGIGGGAFGFIADWGNNSGNVWCGNTLDDGSQSSGGKSLPASFGC